MIRTLIIPLLFLVFHASAQVPNLSGNIMIPYRVDSLWGLADPGLNIILEPQFDELGPTIIFGDGTYFAEKNDKWGILLYDSLTIPCVLENRMADHVERTLLMHYRDTSQSIPFGHLYNLKGFRPYGDTLIGIQEAVLWDDMLVVVIVRLDGSKDIISFDPESHQLYSKMILRADSIYSEGWWESRTYHVGKSDSFMTFTLREIREGRKLESNGLEDDEDIAYAVEDMYDVEKPPGAGRSFTYFWSKVKSDQVELKVTISSRDRSSGQQLQRDSVVAKIKIPSKDWSYIDYAGEEDFDSRMSESRSGNSYYYAPQYIVFEKGGKLGFITEKAIVYANFDSISYIQTFGRYVRNRSFLVRDHESGKYGVLDHNGDPVLEIGYQRIEIIKPQYGGLLLRCTMDGKVGLYSLESRNWVLRCEYDQISQIVYKGDTMEGQYSLMNAGLYGYFSFSCSSVDCFVPPMYEYEVKEYVRICNFPVYSLFKDEQFLGYGDRLGQLYFKD